jgi:hypothetical protein
MLHYYIGLVCVKCYNEDELELLESYFFHVMLRIDTEFLKKSSESNLNDKEKNSFFQTSSDFHRNLDGERCFYIVPRFSNVNKSESRLAFSDLLAYLAQFAHYTMWDVSKVYTKSDRIKVFHHREV